MIGFYLQYELCYTTLLNKLDLAGLPVRSSDRKNLTPIVMAGGPCTCNPEPLADFVDLFVLGEGEEVNLELIDLYQQAKQEQWSKEEYLRRAAQIPGVYVPSLYQVTYGEDGTIREIASQEGAPAKVTKRIIRELDQVEFPERFVVPFIDIVHDRSMLEVQRGCIRGCRFCQAGFIYRPIRDKRPENLNRDALNLSRTSGYDRSVPHQPFHAATMKGWKIFWIKCFPGRRSGRSMLYPLCASTTARKSCWPKSPRCGKAAAFARKQHPAPAGRHQQKPFRRRNSLHLPGDLHAAVHRRQALLYDWPAHRNHGGCSGHCRSCPKVVDTFYQMPEKPKGKGVQVTVSVSCFVPSLTPFEFEPQDTPEQLREKQKHLLAHVRSRKISVKYHDSETSVLEAALARGDRRLGAVLESAWRAGSRLDGWGEHFSMERWTQAFAQQGLDPGFYAHRRRDYQEIAPWSHLDYGVSRRFLIAENKKAWESAVTPHCRERCSGCGAAALYSNGEVKKPCKKS